MKDEFLYLTADKIGTPTGGGVVTYNECAALTSFGDSQTTSTRVISRDALENVNKTMLWVEDEKELEREMQDPWLWDHLAYHQFGNRIKLAHVYAGTFSESIKKLKQNGTAVTYTAAAHDKELSRIEHGKLGFPYAYPHMVDPKLWQRYLDGYLRADVLICPSEHSANVMRSFGATNRIAVIPHGVDLPATVAPFPKRFTVGYLGACGAPDKGLVYLLQAWKKLNYSDATLILGGKDSKSQWVQYLVKTYGGGLIECVGWVDKTEDFYSRLFLVVQPSITEGFGCEVIESMAHGRLALCSTGAGAIDVALDSFPAGDIESLASKIDYYKKNPDELVRLGQQARQVSLGFTWSLIRERYKTLWKELLQCP